MRITREVLLKIARDTAERRVRENRSIVAAYLCGSLLDENFLIGGTTDIDLVFIHSGEIVSEREIVPMMIDDVHLDIAHHYQRDYRNTRKLRIHPWLGPTINDCIVLYDPQHFMDFTQASVRGQFDRSDHVHERARGQAEHARQIWTGFLTQEWPEGVENISAYLRALDHAVNALASLNGAPLTERRLLLEFPARAAKLGHAGLHAGLLGLLGAPNVDREVITGWIDAWRETYLAAAPVVGVERLHPARLPYYEGAMRSILTHGDQPMAVLWPLLRTWTQAARNLPGEAPGKASWQSACERLGLSGPGFKEKIAAFDAYLDQVEETLDEWERANGEG